MKKILTLLAATAIAYASSAQIGVVNVKGDLDTWRSYNAITATFPPSVHSLTAPQGWFSSDTLIFAYGELASPGYTFAAQLAEDAGSHAGAAAAKLTSKDQGPDLGNLPCILSNSKMDLDLTNFDPADPFASITFEGGTTVTERINVVSAWIKYAPVNSDKAAMICEALQGTNVIGDGEVEITQATPNYTKITVNLTYSQTGNPDKLRIIFASSDPSNAEDGSVLMVDDVEAIGASGVRTSLFKNNVVNVYPVPAHGNLNLASSQGKPLVWQAYTIDGKLVASKTFTGTASVDISHMAAGQYTYTVSEINGVAVQNGKFSVQ
jgi:hypothetical protein